MNNTFQIIAPIIFATIMIAFGFYKSATGQGPVLRKEDTILMQTKFEQEIPTILNGQTTPDSITKSNRNGASMFIGYKIKNWNQAYGVGFEQLKKMGFIEYTNPDQRYFCRGLELVEFAFIADDDAVIYWRYPDETCNVHIPK